MCVCEIKERYNENTETTWSNRRRNRGERSCTESKLIINRRPMTDVADKSVAGDGVFDGGEGGSGD